MDYKPTIRAEAVILGLFYGALALIYGFQTGSWTLRFELAVICFFMWIASWAIVAGVTIIVWDKTPEDKD